MLSRVRLCSLGESLGGVETLISHPATMTHAGYTQDERDVLGITNGLVRISVGCEDADDLVRDLEHALAVLYAASSHFKYGALPAVISSATSSGSS